MVVLKLLEYVVFVLGILAGTELVTIHQYNAFPLCAAHPQPAAAAPGHGGRWSPVSAGDSALQTSDVRRGASGA